MNELPNDAGGGAAGEVLVVLTTAPDDSVAARLARGMVEARLAACVNVLPQIRSFYRWSGKLATEPEFLLLIKTTRGAYPRLETWLLEQHPFEVPEILALPLAAGATGYLEWVAGEVGTPAAGGSLPA